MLFFAAMFYCGFSNVINMVTGSDRWINAPIAGSLAGGLFKAAGSWRAMATYSVASGGICWERLLCWRQYNFILFLSLFRYIHWHCVSSKTRIPLVEKLIDGLAGTRLTFNVFLLRQRSFVSLKAKRVRRIDWSLYRDADVLFSKNKNFVASALAFLCEYFMKTFLKLTWRQNEVF